MQRNDSRLQLSAHLQYTHSFSSLRRQHRKQTRILPSPVVALYFKYRARHETSRCVLAEATYHGPSSDTFCHFFFTSMEVAMEVHGSSWNQFRFTSMEAGKCTPTSLPWKLVEVHGSSLRLSKSMEVGVLPHFHELPWKSRGSAWR